MGVLHFTTFPNKPATKAATEMLVMAYGRSYVLPTIEETMFMAQTCSQNLRPKFILLAMRGKPLPIHGDGSNLFNMDANASIKFVENRSFNDQRWYSSNPNWWGDVSGALLPHPRMLMMPGRVDLIADGPGHTEFDAADPSINTAQIGVCWAN
ncbi:hypothetical protein Tco_0098248 [Tanacetum coccineum]